MFQKIGTNLFLFLINIKKAIMSEAKEGIVLDLKEILSRDTKLIKELIKELEIEYDLDFMLKNFKSMFISIEQNRTRAIAVMQIDDKKTKRVQIKTISYKLENKEELTYRLSFLVQLFRQIKSIKEIQDIEVGLKSINEQLIYNGYKYIKGF